MGVELTAFSALFRQLFTLSDEIRAIHPGSSVPVTLLTNTKFLSDVRLRMVVLSRPLMTTSTRRQEEDGRAVVTLGRRMRGKTGTVEREQYCAHWFSG